MHRNTPLCTAKTIHFRSEPSDVIKEEGSNPSRLIASMTPAVSLMFRWSSLLTMQCSNNLKQIGLAVLSYESAFGEFPTCEAHYAEGGREGSGIGWAVKILPFLEQKNIYDAMDFRGQAYPAGNGVFNAQNHQYIARPLEVYRCPSDEPQNLVKTNVWQAVPAGLPLAVTNYAGVLGPHDLGNASIFGVYQKP